MEYLPKNGKHPRFSQCILHDALYVSWNQKVSISRLLILDNISVFLGMDIPSNNPGGISRYDAVGGDIFGDDGPAADDDFVSDSDTDHNNGIRADKTSFSYIGIF